MIQAIWMIANTGTFYALKYGIEFHDESTKPDIDEVLSGSIDVYGFYFNSLNQRC